MERFNGWILARTRAARGLRRIDSALLRGLRVFHNFIRPHGGLGMITPPARPGRPGRRNSRRAAQRRHGAGAERRRPQAAPAAVGPRPQEQGTVQDNPRRRAPKAPKAPPRPQD